MTILGSGNVGIGTSAPSSPLSVESNIADEGVMAHFFDGTMADTDFFTINIGKDATTHDCGVLKFYHTADGHTQNYISLGLKSTEDTLVVNSNGRVGIGIASPGANLHVSGAGAQVEQMKFALVLLEQKIRWLLMLMAKSVLGILIQLTTYV